MMTGVADLTAIRSRLRITGADRVAFLHGQCTNDIERLPAGQSCYAAFLDAKGKMRGEGHVIRLPEELLLETNLGLGPSLEKFVITEDVTIEDVSTMMGEWLAAGDLNVELPAGAVTFTHPLGTGVIGAGTLPVTLNAGELEVARIEAGVPAWGMDLDENTIPVEAGLERRAISYEKGCYIGQETIARIKTYGHVNRQLVQLKLPAAVERGTPVMASDREVGRITSVAGRVALGYVRRELAKPGAVVRVAGNSAEVIQLCGE